MSQVVGLPSNSYKPITNTAWVRAWLCKLQKGYTRLAATSDKVYQLLVHGRWFFPGTPASSNNKTGRHDIAKILLKVALKHQNKFKSIKIIGRAYECSQLADYYIGMQNLCLLKTITLRTTIMFVWIHQSNMFNVMNNLQKIIMTIEPNIQKYEQPTKYNELNIV